MIPITSLWFFGIVVAIAILRRFLPRSFDDALFIGGAAATFLLDDWREGSAVFAVWVFSWIAAHATARRPAFFVPSLLMLTAGFLASYWVSDLRPDIALRPLIGLPYLVLRGATLLDDVRQGTPPPALGRGLTYLLPVHQIVAGPIERYSDFVEKWRAPLAPFTTEVFLSGLNRITDGLIKKLVICELLVQTFGFQFEGSGPQLALEIGAHSVWFYLDFSGYMDIMIGLGIWLGWVPPENFDWPYLSRNIVVFWTKWHITLGTFIRERIFNPTNIALQRGFLRGHPLAAGIVCYYVSMAFCGLWHRPSPAFLVWGLLHGTAIVVCKIWEALLLRSVGRAGLARYLQNPLIRCVSTAMTFSFVAASFVFAVRSTTEAVAILGRLLP